MKKVISLITSASLLITPALATPEVLNTKLSETENRFALTEHSNTLITRGEAVQLLYEALGKPKTYSNNPFIDVTDNYSTAVCWAVQENIIKGIGNGYFAPNALLTTQELAVMLYHIYGSPSVSGLELNQYQDSKEVSAWAKDAILWCVKTGVLPKNSSTLLTPKDNFTKDEFSLVLEHFNELPEITDSELSKSPLTKEAIYQQFINAMTNLNEEVTLDVNGITWQFGAENDLKNIYYSILSDHPELKYAYDMKANVLDNTASCKFSYMPYKTNDYKIPAGSHTINSLHDAKVMAQSMNNGTKELSIAITNPLLEVDDIQLSLAQAGYGWFRFSLNSDGTKIIAFLPLEKSIDDCVTSINESFKLCQEILSKIPMDNMTEREKIQAVYDYVTKNVTYDFRYYSDRNNMPYESMVALGALRDGTAICGGYSQAFEMLLDMLGIENYTVSGISHGENHMWNYIILDGEGYYCDPTADRGGMNKHFMLKEDEFTSSGRYSWNSTFLKKISGFLQ